MRRSLIVSACLAAAALPGVANAYDATIHPHPVRSVETIARLTLVRAAHHQTLLALRRDALAQQARDGGSLTPEHRAALQARLDRDNAQFRRNMINNDPLTVDANGNVVRTDAPAG